MREHCYFMYMLTNTVRHPIYTGVSNSIMRRQPEHKQKDDPDSYTAKYNLHRLVYFEEFQYIENAIDREKQVKPWNRKEKIALRVNEPEVGGPEPRMGKADRKPRSLDSARHGGLRSG